MNCNGCWMTISLGMGSIDTLVYEIGKQLQSNKSILVTTRLPPTRVNNASKTRLK